MGTKPTVTQRADGWQRGWDGGTDTRGHNHVCGVTLASCTWVLFWVMAIKRRQGIHRGLWPYFLIYVHPCVPYTSP